MCIRDRDRRYGIELETSGSISKEDIQQFISKKFKRESIVTKYELSDSDFCGWHIKDDATSGPSGRQGPKGVEIASFVGNSIADLQHMIQVTNSLAKLGCEINENCGFHIHAEATDFSCENLAIILSYWIKIENIISLALPESRKDNYFCKPILERCRAGETIKENLDKSWSSKQIWMLLKPKNVSFFNNDDRKVTLNVVNYVRSMEYRTGKRKTLEFRWPEGTLCGDDVRNWVVLFLSFLSNCKNRKMPKDLFPLSLIETMKILGLYHKSGSFDIYDTFLYQTKIWFLSRIIKFGNDEPAIDTAREMLETLRALK